MKPERSVRLSFWLPIFTSAILFALWFVLTQHHFRHLAQDQVADSQHLVAYELSSLQRVLEHYYADGQFLEAEQALLERSNTTNYENMAILDAEGQVLHASNSDWIGKPISSAVSSFDPEGATFLTPNGLASFSYEDETQQFLAYFPVFRVSDQLESQTEIVGSIYLEFQHNQTTAALLQEALFETLPLLLFLAMVMVVFIGLLHIYVTRPAKHLVVATSALAAGDLSSSSDVRGKGELVHVSNAFNKMSFNLQERMKEVNAMYQMAKAIKDQTSLEEVFRFAVELIPEGWCYPESACVRLVFEGEEYCSEHFKESEWRQTENIVVSGEILGTLEIFYRDQHPTRDEGPFLNEERALLISLTLSISRAAEHAQSMAARESAEMQLRQAQKMEAVGQLTGGIAHDFNNILCIILGNVDLLKMDIDPNDVSLQRLQTIEKSAQRAADLTKHLLGFSRRDATQVAPTDINGAIEEMQLLITRTLTPTIDVDLDFAVDLWKTEIDGADFEDALLNLILNARDAMPSGGSLSITTRNITLSNEDCLGRVDIPPGDYVQLGVSDTGEGILESLREHVFEPFFTTKSPGKGSGLGLAMVYGFTQRSKGAITCTSEQGIGTAFTILLPRSLSAAHTPITKIASHGVLPQGTETILIVDDESDIVQVAKHSLEGLGYRTLTAANGVQALLQLAEHDEIDLLFTDIVMPGGINGHQLVDQALRARPELRTLLTSGYSQNISGSASANKAILRKPYGQGELAIQVREALDAPAASAPTSPQESEQSIVPPTVSWTPDRAIGIDVLDEDHQVLMQLVKHGQLLLLVEDRATKTAFILRELKAYSESHFAREEVVMQACGYPEFENHRNVHQLLLQKLESLLIEQREGKLSAEDFETFLSSLWDDHVHIMDKAIARHCVGKEDCIAQALENYFLTQLPQDET